MTSDRPFAEVIGEPIEHSRSPEIHRFWLDALGIVADYRRHAVRPDQLGAYFANVRINPTWRGSNVTMPLKRAALDLANSASDRAIAAGAANLLLLREGHLFATNTDVGAIMILLERARLAGRRLGAVTVLGTGGAARGALVALKSLGFEQVRIQARNLGAARGLAKEFGLVMPPSSLIDVLNCDVLINATPLGMTGHECLNCDLSHLPEGAVVFDMVSSPAETPLIAAARSRRLAVIDGLDMLIEQAATSFKCMFGQDPPRGRDLELREGLAS